MPGPYRGDFSGRGGGVTWRPQHNDCRAERDNATQRGSGAYCCARSPGGAWVCTRTVGHQGDHVAHYDPGQVLARWGRNGELTDSEEAA